MSIFNKIDGESVIDFIMRLADLKKTNKAITWQLIADCVNSEFGLSRSESWVRRTVKDELGLSSMDDSIIQQVEEQKRQMDETYLKIRKEKVRLSDERCQVNAYYRALSREETIKEIALVTAQEMSSKKMLPKYTMSKINGNKEAILCISDWHYGLEFKNPWNEFSPEICKERISHLLEETISKIKLNDVKKLHLVNLGDLIAGRIHLGLRLDSRFDVITQTMEVSEVLAEFISSLTKYVQVEYCDVLDNHSRLEPIKSESKDLESLARIVTWYLKERLKDNSSVSFALNEYGDDITSFDACGFDVIGVHGHKDAPTKVLTTLNNFTNKQHDLILMAHRHHTSMDESCNTLLVCNGSLMGTDEFAAGLRLTSKPSQNLIICNDKCVMEALYRIEL